MGARLVRVVRETVVGDAIQYEVLAACPLVIDSSSNTIRPMDQAAGGGPNSALTAQRTVARSLDATIDVLVSPRAGFEAIARGTHLWVPLLGTALCRTCWLFAQYPAARRPDRLLMNLVMQMVMALLLYAIMAFPIMGGVWMQGARMRTRAVLAVVLSVGFVTELAALMAALVGNALLGLTEDPSGQTLTNFAGLVSETTNRPLHHLLLQLDAIRLYGVGLTVYGMGWVVSELTRTQVARTVLIVWGGWLFVTTVIKWYVS